ncbi:large conductance mechanosensitive channel protein MscL [Timonella sp. A28]|uniref:large conductance mechanosensitive channel protein MscL n=1 Tax=Timonella sp. A28 TaxID=3442640 RepID=UPI003EBE7532
MLNGFKNFVLRGNVIDLAIAVVIGAAFSKIVTSLVENFMSPLIAVFFGEPDFSQALILKLNGAEFKFGAILTDVIGFLAIGAALYFCIVLPLNKLHELRKKGDAPEPEATPEDIALLQEIRDLLKEQRSA